MSVEAYRAFGYFLFALGLITVLAYVWAGFWGKKKP